MENTDVNVRTMEFIGVDDWERPVYKCLENEMLWKDITLGSETPELYNCGNSFDGEPDSPIKKELKINFNSKYEKDPNRFKYMMLSRLRVDCDYYLGNGNRNKKHLYYEDEERHIEKIKELYKSLTDDERQEWLTYNDILNYEKLMNTK